MSDWRARAKCAGMSVDLFFPGPGNDETVLGNKGKEAKQICARCPVRQECLEYSFTFPVSDLSGVWGGLSHKERKRLGKARRAGSAA